jgi:undecaprenyl-diphosphatase
VVFVAVALAVASFAPKGLSGVETDLLHAFEHGPHWLRTLLVAICQLLAAYAPFIALVTLLVLRRWRRAANLVGSFVVAALVVEALQSFVFDERAAQAGVRQLLEHRLSAPAGFPDAGYLAGLVALVVVEGAWLPKRWRGVLRLTGTVVVLTRLVSGNLLPRDVLVAVAVGYLVGCIGLLVSGGPSLTPADGKVRAALGRLGFEVNTLLQVADGSTSTWSATASDGRRLFVRIVSRDTRSALAPRRIYRQIRLRNLGEERPLASVEQLAEHAALASLKARADGVLTPELLAIGTVAPNVVMTVFEHRAGRPLTDLTDDELTPAVLGTAWGVVTALRRARIAHRRLRLERLDLDPDGTILITGFGNAELGAGPDLLANDSAELLVASAARVGPKAAVGAMVDALGLDASIAVLPRLQPLALTAQTRREAKEGGLLKAVTEELRDRTGVEKVEPAELERLSPRTLILIVLAGFAIYLLAPQLAGASDIWSKVRHAQPGWVLATLVASAVTFVGAAIGIEGSVASSLPFGANVTTQLAAAFAGFATPAQLGGMALNTRFMQRNGVDAPVAVAAVGLNAITAVLVHFALLVAFAVWSGSNGLGKIHLPGRTILIVVGVIALSGAVFAAIPAGRRLIIG